MGNLFDAFVTGRNEGRKRAKEQAYRTQKKFPVKLVEPSTGRIVELRVIEPIEQMARNYMMIMEGYARGLAKDGGIQWTATERTIRMEFTDAERAEWVRQSFRNVR